MTTETNPPHTIGRASVESQELAKFLKTAEPGQVITYVELANAAKVDVQANNSVLVTARNIARRDKGMIFGTIRGVGIKLLSDEEIPDEAAADAKRARHAAKKGIRKLACANYAKLTPETKIKHVTTSTILGFMATAGSRKTLAIAEQHARVSNGQMSVGNIETLFGK